MIVTEDNALKLYRLLAVLKYLQTQQKQVQEEIDALDTSKKVLFSEEPSGQQTIVIPIKKEPLRTPKPNTNLLWACVCLILKETTHSWTSAGITKTLIASGWTGTYKGLRNRVRKAPCNVRTQVDHPYRHLIRWGLGGYKGSFMYWATKKA
jgi:hypothetical protein